MNSGDRTKMRRYQAQAAQATRDTDATTDEVARQQLVERAHKYQRTAVNLKKQRKAKKPPSSRFLVKKPPGARKVASVKTEVWGWRSGRLSAPGRKRPGWRVAVPARFFSTMRGRLICQLSQAGLQHDHQRSRLRDRLAFSPTGGHIRTMPLPDLTEDEHAEPGAQSHERFRSGLH
jgi:hypothetical protein